MDTTSIIAVVADEPEKPALIARTRDAAFFAPRSVHWEIGNAFSAMLKRGRIRLDQAVAAIEAYRQISITWADVDLEQALRLSSRLGIYAYDSYLITCAMDQNCPLLTLDGGLAYAARAAGVVVLEVKS